LPDGPAVNLYGAIKPAAPPVQFPAADKRLYVPFVHARVIRCQIQSQFECGNRILVLVEFPENTGAALRCFGIFRIPVQGLLEFVARG